MKQIIITLDTPEITGLEKTANKDDIAKVKITIYYSVIMFKKIFLINKQFTFLLPEDHPHIKVFESGNFKWSRYYLCT